MVSHFNATAVVDWIKNYDPSRMVDTDSGGPANNLHVGDVNDVYHFLFSFAFFFLFFFIIFFLFRLFFFYLINYYLIIDILTLFPVTQNHLQHSTQK